MNEIRWGILGCGKIARLFAESLKELPDAKLEAISSRTEGKAEKFGTQYKVKKRYTTYEELASDPDIDVIYIATTHNFHYENALLCLNYEKAILCEKAFTVNAPQAEILINTARKKRVFLMEAMWTRFIPCMKKLKDILEKEQLGDVLHVKADYGRNTKVANSHRLFNRELAGGALLDLGIYPISLASMIYKRAPMKITSSVTIGETGVDDSSFYFFEYDRKETAFLSSSLKINMPNTAHIFGTKGYVQIFDFVHPTTMMLKLERKRKKEIKIPYKSFGYNYEAREVMDCLKDGKYESEIMPLDETLQIMKTMDELRSQWNLKYKGGLQ